MDLSRVIWRTSSRSNANGGQCVEVGTWNKNHLGGGNSGSCVEVAPAVDTQVALEHTVDAERLFLVRDSKDPDGPKLAFMPSDWATFLASIKNGDFDSLVV